MANTENDPRDPNAVDPPDTQGGGGEANPEPDSDDATAVDPPETQGGGGGKAP